MDRQELIRRLVLNSICDDYENVAQVILRQVGRDCAKLGFAVERTDVVEALRRLIEDGLAKAYLLSSTEPVKELDGMPPLDVVDELGTYFLITEKGMDLHQTDDTSWRFDDEGEPRGL